MSARYLHSVLLSDFRSFGADVRLDLDPGPGITTIVAPNGTGKTAFMEAIELALGGSTRRVGARAHDVYVHDGRTRARVELDFGLEQRAGVTVDRRAGITRVGAAAWEVLGCPPVADVASLLALTHLFVQNGRHRLHSAAREGRGEVLARIPDLAQIEAAFGNITRVKANLTRNTGDAEASRDAAKIALAAWSDKMLERNRLMAEAELAGRTAPLSEIASTLRSLTGRGWAQNTTAGEILTVSALDADAAALRARLIAESTRLADREGRLASGVVPVAAWSGAVAEVSLSAESLARAAEQRAAAERALTSALDGLKVQRQSLLGAERAATEASAAAARLEAWVRAKSAVETATNAAALATARIGRLDVTVADAEARLQRNADLLRRVEERVAERARARESLAQLGAVLSQWREAAAEMDRMRLAIEVAVAAHATAVEVREQAQRAADLADAGLKAMKAAVETLSARLGTLQRAVASIAEAISEDETRCPVCTTPFGAGVLARLAREAAGAGTGDGALADALDALRTAEQTTTAAIRAAEDAREHERASATGLNTLREAYAAQADRARALASQAPFAGLTLQEAETAAVEEERKLLARIAEIEGELSPLPSVLDAQEEASKTNAALDEARRERDAEYGRRASAVLERQSAEATIRAIVEELGGEPSPDNVAIQSRLATLGLDSTRGAVTEAEAAAEGARSAQAEAEGAMKAAQAGADAAAERVARLRSLWAAAGMEGDPDAAGLERERGALTTDREALDADRATLDAVGEGLARWNSARDLERVTGELGPDPERRAAVLRQDVDARGAVVDGFVALHADVKGLEKAMKPELEKLRADVGNTVQPLQTRLLRAIGRTGPLLAPQIAYVTERKQPKLDIGVRLHGEVTPDELVASEAEQTDFALTFQIAFAMTHRWCDWPALVLDDPTQHHDVPRAAAVFDLLTELSAVHGFQIIVATHDASLARFLTRKALADGVPSALWQLDRNPTGTTATRR